MPSPASSISTLTSEEGDFVHTDIVSPFYEQIIERATRSTALVNPHAWTDIEIVNVNGNHTWVNRTLSQEADFIGFGEIMNHHHGTRTSAKGNAYPPDKRIQDNDTIKFAFAIGQPHDSPAQFQTIFNNQLSVVDHEFCDSCTIYRERAEAARDNDTEPIPEPEYKHFLRSSTLDPSSTNDTILLTSNNIYVANPTQRRSLAAGARTLPSRLANQHTSSTNSSSGSSTSAPSAITLNTTYDPNTTFPDHQGEQFANHQNCRVAQLDFRDENGALVPMADVPRLFRPGAFIQFRVTLHSYDIVDRKTGRDPRRTRSHVLRVHSAQILRESDQDYEPFRVAPPAPSFSPVKRSNNDFDSGSPSKRNRTARGAGNANSSGMVF